MSVAGLAAVNLAGTAVLMYRRPERWIDVWILWGWVYEWLGGANVLAAAPGQIEHLVDYPPWAFITFLPVGLLPPSLVIPASALSTMAMMPAIAWASARVVAPRAPLSAVVVPVLLVLCWGAAIRTVVFTTPLCLLFGLCAVLLAGRPGLAAVCLGLALAKPHIALPFLLWACVGGRWRIVWGAAAVVLAELLVYCAVASTTPVNAILHWLGNVRWFYSGPDALVGITDVRGLLETVVAPGALDGLMLSFVLFALLILWRVRGLEVTRGKLAGCPVVVPAGALVVLLAFYHYWGDLMLAAPAFMAIYLWRDAASVPRLGALAALQVVLMTDVRQRRWLVTATEWPVPWLLDHSYRLVFVAALAALIHLWITRSRSAYFESSRTP